MSSEGERLLVADAHNDLLMLVEHFSGDPGYFGRHWLPQLRAGGVGVQVLPVFVDDWAVPELALRQTLRLIEAARRTIEGNAEAVALCLGPGDVEAALASGRIAAVLALEGCPAIGPDVELLSVFARLGVRMASLTHFGRNSLADGSAEDGAGGRLTRAGVAAVKRMHELGIVIDVSHLSLAGTRHVLEIAAGPVVATHSSCRALLEHHRNLHDSELEAIARSGGVVGINLYPPYLAEEAGIEHVVDHIAHAVKVAGLEHVGLGPDFTKELADTLYAGDHVVETGNLAWSTPGLEGPADLPKIAEAMERRGFSAGEIAAVMGGNWRRLLDEAIGAPCS
jgi:membrane dipeptidase